jgi:4-hydroxy-3-methylbut-2-enyl diphosphate reductase
MLEVRATDRFQGDSRSAAGKRPELKVLLAAPRGFCAGVRRAINAVEDALAVHGPPVYVRRPIVHNLDVVRTLEAQGAIFVEELDQVPAGSVVLFSAHGVSPDVARDARRRNLTAFDAVCPLVSKVHREVERHARDGRRVILIGHRGHPEIEGTLGYLPGQTAFVINSVDEVNGLAITADQPVAYAVQTTYSVDEAAAIIDALRDRFSNLVGPPSSDICYATTNRQNAVRAVAGRADAIIVAGEQFSSNACRLAEVASELCESVQLVAGPEGLDWSLLPRHGIVGITAAASTPDSTVQSILGALEGRYEIRIEEVETSRESTVFKRLDVS